MSIVTAKGDTGKTFLYNGRKVSKDHMLIEACGELDEASSYLGAAKSIVKRKKVKQVIEAIQKDLLLAGSEVSCGMSQEVKLKAVIGISQIRNIEKLIKELENKNVLSEKKFCLSGKNFPSSMLDIARSVIRRVERKIVALIRKRKINNSNIIIYLNRLSDFIYLLARLEEYSVSKRINY